jgi:hypothetical protein
MTYSERNSYLCIIFAHDHKMLCDSKSPEESNLQQSNY